MSINPQRTPYCHKIRYGITGAPILTEDEMDGTHAPGVGVRPTLIEFVYSVARDGKSASVSAAVTGTWTRFGEPADGQVTAHFVGAPSGWPVWLAEEARLHDPDASSAVSVVPPATNQTEAGQAGEDQPETPLEKRLRYSERRNDELRAESLRRGKVNLEYAEKIVALERQIDEVRSQLGAEILRAGQAEAELRRMAAEAPHTATPDEAVVETHVRYQVQLRHQGDADWKTSHPRVDFEDRERAEASAALSRELFPRREYRVVTRTTTITKAPAVVAQPGKEV